MVLIFCGRLPRHKRYLCILTVIGVNLIIYLYLTYLQETLSSDQRNNNLNTGPNDNYDRLLTVIIQDFEEFEHDVVETANSFSDNSIDVIIVSDKIPYPPFVLNKEVTAEKRVHIVSLTVNPLKNISSRRPDSFIYTPYVLFVPDATNIKDIKRLKNAVGFLKRHKNVISLGLPLAGEIECASANIDVKSWTMTYNNPSDTTQGCDILLGNHAILIRTSDFLKLADPYLKPSFISFYVQSVLRGWKSLIFKNNGLSQGKELFKDPHNHWKHKLERKSRIERMYKELEIKKIQHLDGQTEWHGCTKQSDRCFGTVVNDMPDYLYNDKWTPPCCLQHLRETGKHVFKILEGCGVRYWLEGGSLLGAARDGDIIPWDYDIDIGIYQEDINKCENLELMKKKSFVDEYDFVWEAATEGDFFRVQYSESNHLHVDIFPFHSRNGTMTKNTWFKSHSQDTEFPEKYLKPLTKIKFIGLEVSAPNNVKQFLEYKFGSGVVENPKYPDKEDPVS